MAQQKKRRVDVDRERRINIKVLTTEELELYRDLKARAAKKGISLRDLLWDILRKEREKNT